MKKEPRFACLVAVMILVGLGATGCTGKREALRKFGSSFDCPEDRMEIRERNDIKGSQLEHHSEPPPEVKNDPGRYAVWKKKQDEADAVANGGGNYSVTIYEVRGCNHQQLYSCLSKPSCSSRDYPPGIAKW